MRARQFKHLICTLILTLPLLIAATNQTQLTQQLQKSLDKAVADSDTTPGAVLYISSPKTGTIILASGYADKEAKTPMQINNNFRLASISKTFLAVTILKLAAENKINLDDKIANLLPSSIDINRIANGNELTVRNLMQMRSGIPNYTDYDAYTDLTNEKPDLKWTPQDAAKIIYDEKAEFKPNTSYEYSNTNYILLQSIVEHLTGTPIATQFKKFIFGPLHMEHTYVEVQEEQPGGFHGLKTHGYESDEDEEELNDVTTFNDGLGLGDGGVVSTVQDLAQFVKALLESKTLLPPNDLKQMLSGKGPDKYGLGIYQEEVNGEWAFTHNGSSSGFSGQYYYFPDHKLTMIILTNSYSSDIIADEAENVLTIIDESEQ